MNEEITFHPEQAPADEPGHPTAEAAFAAHGGDGELRIVVCRDGHPVTTVSRWRTPDGEVSGDDVWVEDNGRIEVWPAVRVVLGEHIDPTDPRLEPRVYDRVTDGQAA